MVVSECQAAFILADAEDSKSRVRRIDELRPSCACETESVSKISPGIVGNNEILIRVLIVPQHVNLRKGIPKASSLTDAETHGLSVFREEHATDSQILQQVEKLITRAWQAGNAKAGVFGVLRFAAYLARHYRLPRNTSPTFCVYDTGIPEVPAHAEVFQCVAMVDDAISSERRRGLFELVHPSFVPVVDFRNGLLAHLAPPQ